MDEGDYVRIVRAKPGFYDKVTINDCDPLMLGRQGKVIKFAINDHFEPVWMVKLSGVQHAKFFYEEELEIIDSIEGPPVVRYTHEDGSSISFTQEEIDALPRPKWWGDAEEIKRMLFSIEVEKANFNSLFLPYLLNEDQVREHLENLIRGQND